MHPTKITLLLFLSFICGKVLSQTSIPQPVFSMVDTIYLDSYGDKTKHKSEAEKYRITKNFPELENGKVQHTYFMSGKLNSELFYKQEPDPKNPSKKITQFEGLYREWNEQQKLMLEINYKNNKKQGDFISYWTNGQKRRLDKYQDNKLTDSICFDSLGKKVNYYPYETRAYFPGGDKELFQFITKNLHYSPSAQEAGIQGVVYSRFKINTKGEVENITIIRSLHPDLDKEVIRVIKLFPNFIPATHDGEKVDFYFTLPTKFRMINDESKKQSHHFSNMPNL